MISYKPLWVLLIEKDMKKTDLIDVLKVSSATITKMSKNEYVALSIIDKICNYFGCEISQVMEHIPDKEGEN